jgi:hypothetical protein
LSTVSYYVLFERVPEVTIDQNQGSMIDWETPRPQRPESRIHDRLGKGKGSQQQEILEVAHVMLAEIN